MGKQEAIFRKGFFFGLLQSSQMKIGILEDASGFFKVQKFSFP
jgi:hypothetical protein